MSSVLLDLLLLVAIGALLSIIVFTVVVTWITLRDR